jgi:hypothetical protein
VTTDRKHGSQAMLFGAYVILLLFKVSSSGGGFVVSISIEDRQLKGLLTAPVLFLFFIAIVKSFHS